MARSFSIVKAPLLVFIHVTHLTVASVVFRSVSWLMWGYLKPHRETDNTKAAFVMHAYLI